MSIYLNSSEDKEKVLNKLPSESFGNGIKRSLSPVKKETLFIRGIDTSVKSEEIYEQLKHISEGIIDIKRLNNHITGRPRQIVKVLCTKIAAENIKSSDIRIGQELVKIEAQRGHQIIRCYNCQGFGHISRNCKRQSICSNCSMTDCSKKCNNDPLCANCKGNHSAFSTTCPVYISKHEDFTVQHSIGEHFQSLSKPCGTKTRTTSDCSAGSVETRQ